MKKLLPLLNFVFLSISAISQATDKPLNIIDIQGTSKMMMVPDGYKAQFFIQEEEIRASSYQVIGKLSIDSIKTLFFRAMKKYNINENDLKLLGISSRDLGQYPGTLINMAYECPIQNEKQGETLIKDLKVSGLKGLIIKATYSASINKLQDSLYDNAVKDATMIATELAKKYNKTIGEIKSIQLIEKSIPGLSREDMYTDNYNSYNYMKFEMDFRGKFATCTLRVIYELK